MRAALKIIASSGVLVLLTACAASEGRYPSLALRPFETGAFPAAPQPQAAPPIRPAISPAALGALRAAAAAAHAKFLEQEPATERLARAAAGRSIETDARAAALVAMAALSSRRGATSAVLADLDLLAVEASTTLTPDPALAAAQAEVAALITREDAGIARLWEAMRR